MRLPVGSLARWQQLITSISQTNGNTSQFGLLNISLLNGDFNSLL